MTLPDPGVTTPPTDEQPRGLRHNAGDLSRQMMGLWITVPERGAGYLYGIDDQFHDGYPDRHLTLLAADGTEVRTLRFSDSDPSSYPRTMDTPCYVTAAAPEATK